MFKVTKNAEWELISLGNGCYTVQCNVFTDDESYNRLVAMKSRVECGCMGKKKALEYMEYKRKYN